MDCSPPGSSVHGIFQARTLGVGSHFLLQNQHNIMYETSHQSRFDARYWMLGTGALGRPRGRVGEGGGRRVQDGERRYTCGRFI